MTEKTMNLEELERLLDATVTITVREYLRLKDKKPALAVGAVNARFTGRRPWSSADDDLLIELRAQGLTLSEIGQRLARSRDAVRRRIENVSNE